MVGTSRSVAGGVDPVPGHAHALDGPGRATSIDRSAAIACLVTTAVLALTAGRASAHPQAPPAASVAPAQATGADVITPAPVDPELLRPLTPLDQFSVTAQTPKGGPPPRPTSTPYVLTVTGLEGTGLEGRFRELSALRRGKGRAETTAQVTARANADRDLLGRLLRSEGWYDGAVDLVVAPPPAPAGGAAQADGAPASIPVTLTVTPGVRYVLGSVDVTGRPTLPPGLPRAALPLKPRQPLAAGEVEAAEAGVSLRLPQQGYPFVKLGQRDVALDGDAHTGDYVLPVDPGARASFGSVVVEGVPVLSERHLQVFPRFRSGDLYDSRLVDDLRRALVATSLYQSVGVTNVDTGRTAADGTEVVDLRVQGAPAQTRTLAGALGYETGLGATVEASWTDRNLFPPEGSLTVRGLTGTQQQLLGVTFRRADAGQRDRSLQALAQVSREDLDAYKSNAVTLSAALSRDSTPIWQKRWTWSAGAEATVAQETGYDLSLGRSVRRTYEVAALPLLLGYDRSDSLLDPTRGFRLTLRPDPEVSFGDGTQPYFKGIAEATGYYPIGDQFVLASRLRLGGLFGASSQDIAPSRRFFSGGGGSVRGFGYQELGPKDPSGNPIGGSAPDGVFGGGPLPLRRPRRGRLPRWGAGVPELHAQVQRHPLRDRRGARATTRTSAPSGSTSRRRCPAARATR